MNYEIGKINGSKTISGWLCGQFFSEESGLKTGQLEVKYAKMMPGETEPKHYHPTGQEMLIIIEGKMRVVLDGDEHILQGGDFVFQRSGTCETLAEVIEPTTYIAIRTPSVPDNKVVIDQK